MRTTAAVAPSARRASAVDRLRRRAGAGRSILAALALATVVTLASSAPAFTGSDQEQAREAVQSGQARPLDDILRGLGGQVDGRVLDAELDEVGGRWIYRIKVLGRDGRVKILGVDARSGQVLDVR